MGRTCLICRHEEREEIELAIIDKIPYERIAAEYGPSIASISRHKEHMAERIAKVDHARDIASGGTLLQRLEDLETHAKRIGQAAEEQDRLSIALQANREQQRIIEILLKVAGELKNQTEVNITISPEWIQLRSVIFKVLENYPEAKAALAAELQRVQHGEVAYELPARNADARSGRAEDYVDATVKELPSGQY